MEEKPAFRTFEISEKGCNTKHCGVVMLDVEYANPVEYLISSGYLIIYNQLKSVNSTYPIGHPKRADEEVLKHIARERFNNMMKQIVSQCCLPQQIIDLLQQDLKKKEQISLLKDIKLRQIDIPALMIEADKQGYTFSQYSQETLPKDLIEKQKPVIAKLDDDDNVSKCGSTDMTDGQIRSMINQRNKIVAKIFDKGDHWHCFYLTYKGLQGNEHGNMGRTPHMHYTSDSFGITREDLVKSIKSGNVNVPNIHIIANE